MHMDTITSPAGLLVFSQIMLGLVALVQLQLGGLLLFFWGQYYTNLSFLGFLWALLPIDLESTLRCDDAVGWYLVALRSCFQFA